MRKTIILALALAFAGATAIAKVPDNGQQQQAEKGHHKKK